MEEESIKRFAKVLKEDEYLFDGDRKYVLSDLMDLRFISLVFEQIT